MKILCKFILEDKRRLILDITALEVLKDSFFSQKLSGLFIFIGWNAFSWIYRLNPKLNQLAFRQSKFECVRNFQLAPNMSRHVAQSR